MQEFYMVSVDQEPPSMWFASSDEARLECERLAKETQKPVYLLMATDVCTPSTVQWVELI